ncbi:MAG: tetraacyldisaccharide 4'-kinase [Agarilytica sp.]
MSTLQQSISAFVEKRWYGNAGVLRVFTPLEYLFSLLVSNRKKRQQAAAQSVGAPLIIVGNISVGGTGKTPMIISLCKFLQSKGLCVGVISRGYGRQTQGLQIAHKNSTAVQLGDEPFEIYRNTQCCMVVSDKRLEAAQYLVKNKRCDVILADDGLQHYKLFRDKELVLVDGLRGFGNGHLLPVGPLREPVSRLADADWVIKNASGCESASNGSGIEYPQGFSAIISLKPEALVNVRSGQHFPLEKLSHLKEVHAVAGIASPDKFFNTLRTLKLEFEPVPLADHHQYQSQDLGFSGDIIMTEKDAVKCAEIANDRCYFLKTKMHISDQFLEDFFGSVKALIDQYKNG